MSSSEIGLNTRSETSEVVRFFHRHFVPIYVEISKDGARHRCFITSFVMSVRDEWFLITAGHCIDDIRTNLRNGAKIERSYLVDTMGEGPRYEIPIPFRIEDSQALSLDEGDGFDYGIMQLTNNERQLLEANKIKAISEQAWDLEPENPEHFWLIGVPSELLDMSGKDPKVTPDVPDPPKRTVTPKVECRHRLAACARAREIDFGRFTP